MLSIAVIFYQLHGISYFDFGWPTTAEFKQKSYNLMKSPLFWTAVGSGMITFALWKLYKKRSAPGGGVSQSSSASVTASSAPAAGALPEQPLESQHAEEGRKVASTSDIKSKKEELSSKIILSKISEIIGKMDPQFLQILCAWINAFSDAHPILDYDRISTCNHSQDLISYFNQYSFFKIFYVLNEVEFTHQKHHRIVNDLKFIYAMRHLLVMMPPEAMKKFEDYLKKLLKVESVTDYLITQLTRNNAQKFLLSLMMTYQPKE